MSDTVTIYIDNKEYEVPKGANLVDVAKYYADEAIPVFCYHPKMEPVGMCRMCLVELGFIQKDRETGEVLRDEDGQPQVRWFPNLQTACTQIVSDGMVVRSNTEKVAEGRDDILEFLLTSHPLDCPICDKGGECPLQNLTMAHGPGKSRFYFEDKMKLGKHIPLGDLIYLDQERCIQCARCTRFQDELVGDDVLAFHERGRRLQIISISDPPFDSYWSGNTTDICPVGALTTTDFRFGARPWELKEVPSLDPYGPEGANISLSMRLDRDSGGVMKIKRVMPRQNEYVNEIWISDKTRFGHHHTLSPDRLTKPKVRVGDRLVKDEWEHALEVIGKKLKQKPSIAAIAGPTLSNEDLWTLRQLVEAAGGGELGVWPGTMTGGDIIQQVGVASGTNFKDMGSETAIVIVASDLEEEAPIWWLRAKRAGDRGTTLITLNARETKIDRYARHHLRYAYGEAVDALQRFHKGQGDYKDARQVLDEADNVVVIVGNEGLTLDQHSELMKAAANLLIETGHVGRPNNGLLAVWPGANTQGAFDLGFSAEATARILQDPPELLLIAGCDPLGDAVEAASLNKADFIVVNSLFQTATADIADVVLPSQSFAERDGSFTSGERRIQRFYPAQGVIGQSQPDWKIYGQLHHDLDGSPVERLTGNVFKEIAENIPAYQGLTYKALAQTEYQFPDVGDHDLYYGGTAYKNSGGLGVQYPSAAEAEDADLKTYKVSAKKASFNDLAIIPTTRLYNRGYLFKHSEVMHTRTGPAFTVINPADAGDIVAGDQVAVTTNGQTFTVQAVLSETAPQGAVLLPRLLVEGPSLFTPATGTIERIAEPVTAEG